MVEDRRPRGRPPRRWVNDIKDWCHADHQMDLCAVTAMAQDRNLWKEFTTISLTANWPWDTEGDEVYIGQNINGTYRKLFYLKM